MAHGSALLLGEPGAKVENQAPSVVTPSLPGRTILPMAASLQACPAMGSLGACGGKQPQNDRPRSGVARPGRARRHSCVSDGSLGGSHHPCHLLLNNASEVETLIQTPQIVLNYLVYLTTGEKLPEGFREKSVVHLPRLQRLN